MKLTTFTPLDIWVCFWNIHPQFKIYKSMYHDNVDSETKDAFQAFKQTLMDEGLINSQCFNNATLSLNLAFQYSHYKDINSNNEYQLMDGYYKTKGFDGAYVVVKDESNAGLFVRCILDVLDTDKVDYKGTYSDCEDFIAEVAYDCFGGC